MPEQALAYFSSGPTLAICRHVIVCEVRSVISFFRPDALSAEMHAYDPLPPVNPASKYDDSYFGPLSSLLPQGRPTRVQQQFRPGGDVEGLLRQLEELQFGENVGGDDPVVDEGDVADVPGGFAAAEEAQDAETSEDEDEEARPQQRAPGFLQTFWNGLFGRAAPEEEESTEEEA